MEMLITTLILSLVMVIVTSGVAVAQKLYRKTMAKADADGKTVKRYHKNGFWYALANGPTGKSGLSANFLYKTFSATGESENTLYEPLSASKSDRLEDIYVSVPVITYDSGENRFYVSGLRVMLDETTVIAGADSAQSGGTETPYLIVSALNQVKVK